MNSSIFRLTILKNYSSARLWCVLQCEDQGGCLAELAIQLAVIMIGKQIINNCQEIMIPCVT